MISRLLISSSTDPFLNSLWEKQVFRNLRRGERLLLLWRNSSSIHIGRHQNPWIECNVPLCHSDSIPIIRRSSGGGAVYHDFGNSLYSFQGGKSTFKRDFFLEEILKILNPHLKERLSLNERHDIIQKGLKVGGSAFRISKDTAYHHGTLLLSAQLDRMSLYLAGTFPYAGFDVCTDDGVSHHTPSVRSKTANIDIEHETLCTLIKKHYSVPVEHYGSTEIEEIIDADELKRMKGWHHLYGKCPSFTLKTPNNGRITIKNGCVELMKELRKVG